MFAKLIQGVLVFALFKTLATLGFGFLVGTAVIVFINQAIGYAKAAYNNLPTDMLQLLAVAGVPEVLGILCGAIIASAGLQFLKRFTWIG